MILAKILILAFIKELIIKYQSHYEVTVILSQPIIWSWVVLTMLLNCIRQRLMVRFLSVFPKPGAESLLRAATVRFEKLKRECSRNAMKLDGEECRQANLELEENDEPDNVEDDEEEAADGNNSDEEWDAYEEPDLAGDSEMPLPSDSYLNMENISRTHLQELFGSFPSNEIDGEAQENGSGDEYHIYEEDSDDNNSGE